MVYKHIENIWALTLGSRQVKPRTDFKMMKINSIYIMVFNEKFIKQFTEKNQITRTGLGPQSTLSPPENSNQTHFKVVLERGITAVLRKGDFLGLNENGMSKHAPVQFSCWISGVRRWKAWDQTDVMDVCILPFLISFF